MICLRQILTVTFFLPTLKGEKKPRAFSINTNLPLIVPPLQGAGGLHFHFLKPILIFQKPIVGLLNSCFQLHLVFPTEGVHFGNIH